jgi:hypothetical protein
MEEGGITLLKPDAKACKTDVKIEEVNEQKITKTYTITIITIRI